MPIDLEPFEGVLPYASELYGIYQPLLGWRSQRAKKRIDRSLEAARNDLLQKLPRTFSPRTEILSHHPRELRFKVGIAVPSLANGPIHRWAPQSLVARRVMAKILGEGPHREDVWQRFTSGDFLERVLNDLHGPVETLYEQELQRLAAARANVNEEVVQRAALQSILARESTTAGTLQFIGRNLARSFAAAYPESALQTPPQWTAGLEAISAALDVRKSELARAVISPIGIVHLFRQYFFEFDAFLGPPVEHLWLSPGGMVELIEISTRRTLIERATEDVVDSLIRTDKSSTMDDELSEAVRRQNSSSTKFGISVNAHSSLNLGSIFTAAVDSATRYDLDSNQQEARESLHRSARHQTEYISSTLHRSFRSTFRVTTESTDTRSRKYVLRNRTKAMMNYEIRRKMRQVGVQLQDYGTYLCWQTYVDKPGDELGVANLVHIAVPNDMPPPVQPDLPAEPQPYKGESFKHHFRWPLGDGSMSGGLDPEHFRDVIAGVFPVVPNAGFKLDKVEVKIVGGESWGFGARPVPGSDRPVANGVGETTATAIEVYHPPNINDSPGPRQPLTDENPQFDFEVTPYYKPSDWLLAKVASEKEQKIKDANQERERAYKEKLFAAIKERVTLASKVQPRPFEDLREEERIVVYRNLIRQLMADIGVTVAEPRLQHLFAELVQSMFDVDKMLYFVAPEWWMPQNRTAGQDVFRPEANEDEFRGYSTVSWGGGKGLRDDNYYITESSATARLGSSLGWILQLDGDNLRNAFLNAPWVKAVVPIRPGREERALGWLQSAEVEGADGLDALYEAPDEERQRVREALGLAAGADVTLKNAIEALIKRLAQRAGAARQKDAEPDGTPHDYLPLDQVYEKGFKPLQGGFRVQAGKDFEVFDQWVEVVPTDQIVPVAVEYDPKTGRLK